MARAEVRTQLSLDEWARIIGIHPLHWNQVIVGTPTVCQQPWFQHPWQDVDRVGREDVAIAIAEAEADIERFLHFRLKPTWEVDEFRPTVRPHDPALINLGSTGLRGFNQIVETQWKWFISGGIEAKTLVAAGAAVVYTDADGDGYDETATVTQAVTFTDPCEVAIYFPGEAAADEWEIRPIEVSIAAGVATVVFRREQLVDPDLVSVLEPAAVDGTVDGNFLTTVDVYRHFNDPQQQANLLWEAFAGECCGTSACSACQFSTQTACLNVRGNPRIGIVPYEPAAWDATEEEFTGQTLSACREPDLVRLWYYAGLQDKSLSCVREMTADWKRTVAYYAASLLDRPVCECNNIQAWIENWRLDLARTEEVSWQLSAQDLNSPFGTKRGGLYAWKRVKAAAAAAEFVPA